MLRERADPNLNNRVSQKTCTRGNAEVREANPAEAADPESGGHAAALCSHARGGHFGGGSTILGGYVMKWQDIIISPSQVIDV